MSSIKFLDYEVALLLAKYGKSALLLELGKKIDATPEELENILRSLPAPKQGVRRRKKPSTQELFDGLLKTHPDKGQLLRTLHDRFENRTFLPELRDVKRFFERHKQTLGSTKSRADAFPKLLRLLSELQVSELDTLCVPGSDSTYSSLGIISDEILRQQ